MSTNGYNNVNEIAPAMLEHPGAWPMRWRRTDMDNLTPAVQRIVGRQYDRWTVIRYSHSIKTSNGCTKQFLYCECSCGNNGLVSYGNLTTGQSRSCGCILREITRARSTLHGKCKRGKVHPVYRVWQGMLQRCTDSTRPGWDDYGGRGIKVCERWQSFPNFDVDMSQSYMPGLSIGRIDNDGPYSPENCRWETRTEQNNNSRRNRLVTARGKTQTIGQWATELGVPYSLLHWRLDEGWEHERIVSQPSRKKGRLSG